MSDHVLTGNRAVIDREAPLSMRASFFVIIAVSAAAWAVIGELVARIAS